MKGYDVVDAPEIDKGQCPECGPSRNADIVASYYDRVEDEQAMIWGATTWEVLKCRGCSTVYVRRTSAFSEDTHHYRDIDGNWIEALDEVVSYWPAPSTRVEPEWSKALSQCDATLGSLFEDVYGCLNADLKVPAAIAMRTAFDRAAELLDVDPTLAFVDKLESLVTQGRISPDEREALSALIDAGSAAVHRGWRPTSRELDTMAKLMEAFLHRTFVLAGAARELRGAIPARAARKKVDR